MNISDYQVHKVLKMYSRSLAQAHGEQFGLPARIHEDSVSREHRRNVIVEKITSKIFDKIARLESEAAADEQLLELTGENFQQQIETKKARFIYNVIESGNNRRTCKFSLEDTEYWNSLES